MSRSRKKFAVCGFACGNNTPFYKAARKHLRRLNSHKLRNLLANFDIEYVEENITHLRKKEDKNFDSWDEPTDGKILLFKHKLQDDWDRTHYKKLLRK